MAVTRYAGDRFVIGGSDNEPTGVLDGAYLINTGDLAQKVLRNGSWVALSGAGGGGSANPGTPLNSVQFNSSSTFAGNANLTFTDGNRLNVNKLGISGNVYDSNNSLGEGGMVLTNEGQTGVNWKSIESVLSGVGGSGVTNYVARWSDEDTLTTGSIYDNASKVGISTASPQAELHIYAGTIGGDHLLVESTNTAAGDAPDLVLYRNSPSPANGDDLGILRFRGKNDGTDTGFGENKVIYADIEAEITSVVSGAEGAALKFYTQDNGSSAARMVITGSNVGIGTASPYRKLHINGDAIISGKFYDVTNSTGDKGYVLTSDDNGPVWAASGNFDGLSGNLVATGAIIDGISGNLITTGQTLTSEINTVSGNLIATGAIVDDISGNLITTGQTLTNNLIATGAIVDSVSGNLITTGQTLTTNINTVATNLIATGAVIDGVSGNLITTGQTLTTNINTVATNLIASGAVIDDVSGNLIQTGQYLTDEIAIVSGLATGGSAGDFTALSGALIATGAIIDDVSGNLITTGQTLTTNINTVSTNLVATGAIVDDISGNLITTGQTLTTNINTVSTNLIATGAIVDDISGNLITTGQTLTNEIAIVSGLVATGAIDGSGVANYVARWSDEDTLTTGIIYDNAQKVGISTASPQAELHIYAGVTAGDHLLVESTNTAAGDAPDLVLYRNSPSPANSDDLGIIRFRGKNNGTDTGFGEDKVIYADIEAEITSVVSGSEGAALKFYTQDNGSLASRMVITGSNVGIGTVSPYRQLHINGDAIISGKFYDQTNSTGDKGYVLTSDDNGPLWKASGDFDGLSGNLVATGAIVDDISGNLITTGQTLTANINTVASNLITSGQTLQTQITSNDTDIANNTANLITTGQTLQTQITANDGDISTLTTNLITTGQTLTSEIAIVSGLATGGSAEDFTALSGALIATGAIVDDVSGNLITTGQTLQAQITSNDADITTLTSNLITTGQTLQTQITANDGDISTLTTNLITTGQTLTSLTVTNANNLVSTGAIVDDISGNLITTGQTLTSEIATVSGLIPATIVDGGGTANTVPRWTDSDTIGDSLITVPSNTSVKINASGADAVRSLRIDGTNGSSEIAGFILENDGANAKVNLKYNIGNGTPATKVTLNHLGYVGINTTAPAIYLHNHGSALIGRTSGTTGGYVLSSYDLVLSNGNSGTSILLYNSAGAFQSSLIKYDANCLKLGLNSSNSTNAISTATAVNVGSVGVGIGTVTPGALLEVYKSSGAVQLYVNSNSIIARLAITGAGLGAVGTSSNADFVIQRNGTTKITVASALTTMVGEVLITTGSTSVRTLSGVLKADTIENNSGASNLKLQTESGGNKHIEITPDGTGNVGIGTDAPAALLNLFKTGANDAVSSAIYLQRAAGNYGAAILQVGNGSSGSEKLMFTAGHNSDPMSISNAKMTIQQDGNVGIGTTDPKAPVHLFSNGSGNTQQTVLCLGSNTSNRPSLQFSENQNAGFDTGMSIEYRGDFGAGGANGLTINGLGADATTSGAAIATFLSGGSVGIGTTDPDSLLMVYKSGADSIIHVRGIASGADARVRINGYNSSELYLDRNGVGRFAFRRTTGTDDLSLLKLNDDYSDDSTIMFWDYSSGDVGIGQASASYKLDVNGTGRFNDYVWFKGGIRDDSGSAGSNGQVLTTNGSNAVTWATVSGGVSGSGTDHFIPRWNGTTALQDSSIIALDSGSVGIGNATPSARLFITGDSSSRAFQAVGSSTTAGVGYFYTNEIHSGTTTNAAVSIRSDHASSSGQILHVRGDGSGDLLTLDQGGTSRVVVKAAGSVGIGTDAPDSKLEIAGGGYNSSLKIKGSGADTGIQFEDSAGNTDGYIYAAGDSIGILDSGTDWTIQCKNDDYIRFCTNGATEHMRIKSDGKVGIGTATPGSLLTVSGNSDDGDAACTIAINDEDSTVGSKIPAIQFYGGGTTQGRIRGGDAAFQIAVGSSPTTALNINTANGYPSFTYGSQVRLTLGSTGTAETNTANWVRANGANLEFNAASGDFNWEVGGVHRMRLTDTGFLGLGLGAGTDPFGTLHVNGTNGSNIHITRTSGGTTSTFGSIIFGNTNIDSSCAEITGDQDGANDSGRLEFGTQASVVGGVVTRMTIKGDGKVGIGTATPANKLNVYDGTDISPTSGAAGQFAVAGNGYSTFLAMNATAAYFGHNSSGRALALMTDETARLTILGGGSVGIGTDAPQVLLDVYTTGTDIARFETTSTDHGRISIRSGSAGDAQIRFQNAAASKWSIGNDGGDSNKFKIAVGSGAFAAHEVFTITTSGSVGIGTGTPTRLLHVSGTAYFSGDIYYGNTVLNIASGYSNQTGMGWDESAGQLQIAANNTTALEVGRHTGTGTVFSVRYASTQKASIDTSGNMSLAGTLTEASSLALKENIEDFTPSLDIINKIRPVKYNKKKESKKEIGLIAEELAELFPELVDRDNQGNPSGVNYSRAVTVLLGGFKELYKEIEELKKRI